MKLFFLVVLILLGAMSLLAWRITPEKVADGRVPLVWMSDPNPERVPQIAEYNRLYPGNHLTLDPDNSGVMKVMVQCSAKMGPDLIDFVTENSFQTYVDAGILLDVTEQAAALGCGADTLPESVRPLVLMRTVMPDGTVQDRQYLYPSNVGHQFIIYNKSIFDKFGVKYPPEDLTWERYVEIAKKLTVYGADNPNVPEIFGGAGIPHKILIWEKGGEVLNRDGTRCLLDSPEVAQAMTFYHDLMFRDRIEPTPRQQQSVSSQGGWGGGFRNWFGEGKIAMLFGSRWMLVNFRQFVEEQQQTHDLWVKNGRTGPEPEILRLGACLVPRFQGGVRYTECGARCTGVNSQGRHTKEAVTFLQYLASAEYSKILNHGGDCKPGNQSYNKLELFLNKDYPEERPVHEMSLKSIPYGRVSPRSMFISNAKLDREFQDFKDKLVNAPQMSPEDIAAELKKTAGRINLEISRNIKRTPSLKRKYEQLLKQGAEPVVVPLEEVKE